MMRVVVTGTAGILGHAVVRSLAADGNRTVAISRVDRPGFSDCVKQIICQDLADPAAVGKAIATARRPLGAFDALVLVAGGFESAKVKDAPVELWRRLYRDNVEATLVPLKAALKFMAEGGSIVCVSATAAQSAGPGMAAYAAAKSGVARLTEALAEELRPRRIRVNAILPAIIDTPANRAAMPNADPAEWTSPAAIADVVKFLLSAQSRAINGVLLAATNGA